MALLRRWVAWIDQLVAFLVWVRTKARTITTNVRAHTLDLSTGEGERFRHGVRRVYRTEELPHELANAIATAEPNPRAFAFDHEVNGKEGTRSL